MATPPVTTNEKPEKFTRVGFKQWQQKMYFYLTMLNLTKYLSEVCPIISPNEQDVTMLGALEAWKHGDFLCRNYILNCLVNSLYNVYCNIEYAKQLWESLEKKNTKLRMLAPRNLWLPNSWTTRWWIPNLS
ncbi:hypothetical protein ACJRO7_034707 [Eucalyptus globulus]|uniref:Uncharacterized protein n=1 Tax=Eucalyptus globulus TaxID=34317 RepID=A0ABD3J3M5_EUCGL